MDSVSVLFLLCLNKNHCSSNIKCVLTWRHRSAPQFVCYFIKNKTNTSYEIGGNHQETIKYIYFTCETWAPCMFQYMCHAELCECPSCSHFKEQQWWASAGRWLSHRDHGKELNRLPFFCGQPTWRSLCSLISPLSPFSSHPFPAILAQSYKIRTKIEDCRLSFETCPGAGAGCVQ